MISLILISAQMCIFMCLGGNSTTWMNTAVLVTCIRNFRKNRGPVSGILKGYIGLSTAIFTDLCSALFSDSPSSFLLMLSIVPFVVCLSAMVFLLEVDPSASAAAAAESSDENSYFAVFNVVAVIIAVYLLVFDISGEHGRTVSQIFAVVLLVLMAVPLGVPIYARWKARRGSGLDSDAERQEIGDPLLIGEKVQEEVEEEEERVEERNEDVMEVAKRRPVIGEEHTIVEAFGTVDFWILFVSFLCGVGTGLAVMNNMGQMGLALGYVDVSIFVSLTSIWGFFGRIGSGSISEYFIK